MSKLFGIHVPVERPNLIINGNNDFWQRGTSFTNVTANAFYYVDRFNFTRGAAITGLNNTLAQSSDVPTVAESGFKSLFSQIITNTAAATNLAASGQVVAPTHHIEGYSISRCVGKIMNLSFWVKSSVTGVYAICFSRQFTDSYVSTYTINAANTWEKKNVNVYIDPAVSWTTNNGLTFGRGMGILWTLGAGTTNQTSTLNSWQIGTNILGATTASNNFPNVNGATWQLAQVMFTEGVAPAPFERAGSTIEEELAKCERYLERCFSSGGKVTVAGTSGSAQLLYLFRTEKRIAPTPTATTTLRITDVTVNDYVATSPTFADSGTGVLSARININTVANWSPGLPAIGTSVEHYGNNDVLLFDAEL